jgi:hypothetical protein
MDLVLILLMLFSGYKIVISKKNGHKEVENMFGLIPHWEESDYTEFRWEDVV